MIGRARLFAARLLARYRLGRRWSPGAAFVFLRRANIGGWIAQSDTHIRVAPAIGLTLSVSMPARLRAGPAPAPLYYSRAPRGERWAERVIVRYQRVEPLTPGRTAATPAAPGALRSAEAPLSLRLPPLPVVRRKPDADGADQPAPTRVPTPSSRAVAAHAHTTVSPMEITRLTDHVMRALDRRLAAFRERHGRS